MSYKDDEIAPVAGTAAVLSVPTQSQILAAPHLLGWPPAYFGEVPILRKSVPILGDMALLKHIDAGYLQIPHRHNALVNVKRKCPLLLCWSAQIITIQGYEYLGLPATEGSDGKPSHPTHWIDDAGFTYPSELIFIRKSYKDIADLIFEEAGRHSTGTGVRMVLSGTSGTGKSFFSRYFVWRLLHPTKPATVPETIVWRNKQGGSSGCMYHRGRFYMIEQIEEFVSSIDCANLLDEEDAWLIYDGEPPKDLHLCKCLVISSPGNLYKDVPHIKQFRKSTPFKLYLPTWSAEELIEVSRRVHGTTNDQAAANIIRRYERFGGIARYVLQEGFSPDNPVLNDPVKDALNTRAVVKVICDVGTEDVDQTKTSGVLIHLIPDESYRTFKYEWGSTYIMMEAFAKLFKITKKKVETFIAVGTELHLGTFYGLIFEPWFHQRIPEQGYVGKMRKLTTGKEMAESKKKKRPLFAFKDGLNTWDHHIPRSDINRFKNIADVDPEKYNIPTDPNFPAIDGLWPSRGEMYQVTSADSHPVKVEIFKKLKPLFSNWLSKHDTVKFIFVVPPNRFEEYTLQRYVVKEKEKVEQKGTKITQGPENPTDKGKKSEGAGAAVESQKPAKTESTPKPDAKVEGHSGAASQETTKAESKTKTGQKTEGRSAAEASQKPTKAESKAKAGRKGKQKEPAPAKASVPDDATDTSWIEQFVLRMDVNPLTDAMVAKLSEEKDKRPRLGKINVLGA